MGNRHHVALLLPDLRPGGAEWVNVLLASGLVQRGWRVTFLLLRAEGELIARLPAGCQVVDLGVRRYRYALPAIARALRRLRPDAVAASMWPLTALAVLARGLSGGKFALVLVEHSNLTRSAAVKGASDLVNRKLGRLIYGKAHAVVAVSQGVKEDLVARTGLASDKVTVVYNPVRPPDPSARAEASILAWWDAGGAKLISVGSLKPAKDFPTLIRSFAELRRRREARLLILGEGGERDALEALASELGLTGDVLLAGQVADPYPYLERADLFVLSSAWEGLGNVITEALSVGTPVVSTDCASGPAEILESGRYGRLAPVGDAAALARAIEASLGAPVDKELLKRRAAEFSVERAADQYLALLDPARRV